MDNMKIEVFSQETLESFFMNTHLLKEEIQSGKYQYIHDTCTYYAVV